MRGGVGIGWRPEIAGSSPDLPGLRFTEVVAESVGHGPRFRLVADLRDRGVAVVPHGVKLSLGGAEPVDPARVAHLAACAAALDAPLVSEHIAFVRAGGVEAGHLLPVPRTRDAVDAVVANVSQRPGRAGRAARAGADRRAVRLARRRARRGASSSPRSSTGPARCCCSTSPTCTPTRATAARTREPARRVPLERIAYVHVAGGAEHDGLPRHAHRPGPAGGARAGDRAVRPAAPPPR